MARYKLICVKTFETVIPADIMEYRTIYGELVDSHPVPERRWTTEKGTTYTARNKKDADKMIKTGNWKLIQ